MGQRSDQVQTKGTSVLLLYVSPGRGLQVQPSRRVMQAIPVLSVDWHIPSHTASMLLHEPEEGYELSDVFHSNWNTHLPVCLAR